MILPSAFKVSALYKPGNKRSSAVAVTAAGVHLIHRLGTTRTASSRKTSKLHAAPSAFPANVDKPGWAILKTPYSYSEDTAQLSNTWTWS